MAVAAGLVAILATMAYPSYTQHISTSRRADAQGALLGLAAAMERHATTHSFKYTGAAGSKGSPADSGDPWIVDKMVPAGAAAGKATYTLKIESSSETSFTLKAIPTGKQAGDKCGTLTLDSTGQRKIENAKTGVTTDDCWRK